MIKDTKDLIEFTYKAIDEALSNTHTITIAKVVKVETKTIDVKVVFKRKVGDKEIEYPIFTKVPPIFMQGGGSYTAHPIAVGDYCLLLITERCFDNWYYGKDNQVPLEYRIHDYSDAFALVGVNPAGTAFTIPNVITHIGDTYAEGDYEQVGNYDHTGNRVQSGNYTLTGDFTINGNTIKNGNLTVSGNISIIGGAGGTINASNSTINLTNGDVIADGISLKNHTHTDSVGGTTSPPIGG